MPRIIKSRDGLRQRINVGTQLIEVLPAIEFARAINILLAKLREKTG